MLQKYNIKEPLSILLTHFCNPSSFFQYIIKAQKSTNSSHTVIREITDKEKGVVNFKQLFFEGLDDEFQVVDDVDLLGALSLTLAAFKALAGLAVALGNQVIV